MCNKYGKIVLLAAVIAVFGLAANVQAEVIYDFEEGLNAGALLGQDGWYKPSFGTGEAFQVGSGASGWSGKYATADSSDNSYAMRVNDTNWSYSLTDGLDFDVSADFSVTEQGTVYSKAGIGAYVNSWPFCILMTVDRSDVNGPDMFEWRIRMPVPPASWLGPVTLDVSDTFPEGVPSIITLGWAITATGPGTYDAQPFYDDGSRVNVGSALSFTSAQTGEISTIDGLFMQVNRSGGIIDNITIDQIPEPSTMTLLACGLIGLLAYAWRKRK